MPTGETWIVKRAVTFGSTSGLRTYWQYTDPDGHVGQVWQVTTVPNEADDHETWWAMDAGSVLKIVTIAAGTTAAWAFGAKLLGVAP